MCWTIWLPILVWGVAACRPPSQVHPPTELMVASVGPEEDLDGLARRYLGDASRKWIIQDYNQIDTVSPGQLVLIPRWNYRPAGLTPDGYQMVPVLAYPDLAASKSEETAKIVEGFRRQMQFLQDEGYHVIDAHQLAAFMAFEITLPPKAVILTFEDQSRLFYDLILPILRTHQIPGTLFIDPQDVGAPSMADWSQLREMTESGMSIQYRFSAELAELLQSSPFPDRSTLTRIATTLARERDQIETNIGQPCRYLSYAEDQAATLVIMLAQKAGFSGSFNCAGNSNPFYRNPFAIERDRVKWNEPIDSYYKHLEVFKKEALR